MQTYFYTITMQFPLNGGFHLSTKKGTFTRNDYATVEELYEALVEMGQREYGYTGRPNVMNFTVLKDTIL